MLDNQGSVSKALPTQGQPIGNHINRVFFKFIFQKKILEAYNSSFSTYLSPSPILFHQLLHILPPSRNSRSPQGGR